MLQCIFKRALRLGICAKFDNKIHNPTEHLILKKLMNVPLLPHEKIEEGLELLKGEVKRSVDDPKRRAKWDEMFGYVNKECIKIVQPINLTFFNALDRTDNNAESYHRDLNREMGSKPNCPIFMGMCNYFLNH